MPIINIPEAAATPADSFTPSPFQEDIYRALACTQDNLIIEAVAGSGKTSTIIQALSLIPTDKRVLFVAFNKAIATELSARVPFFVEARTLHSVGYQILRDNYHYVKSNGRKLYNHLRYHMIDMERDEYKEFFYANQRDILAVVSGLKTRGEFLMTAEIWDSITENPRYDLPDTAFCLSIITELLAASWEFTGEKGACLIDFDDMICYPAYLPMDSLPTYDYVFVDEAQDLNEAQHTLISKLVGGGRLIAVGDTHQAIYGFRGAASDSMEVLRKRFSCLELPLSISYRCPRSVVDLASRYCPHMQVASDAPEGRVISLTEGGSYRPSSYVICRTWAPLLKDALRILRSGSPVWVNGKDIVPAIHKVMKLTADRQGVISPASITRYEDHLRETESSQKRSYKMSMCEALRSICTAPMLVDEVKDILAELITDRPERGAITFTTIHRVKGLEADHIYILHPEDIPHRKATTPEEIQQEYNLLYVAITRSKKNLYLVNKR